MSEIEFELDHATTDLGKYSNNLEKPRLGVRPLLGIAVHRGCFQQGDDEQTGC